MPNLVVTEEVESRLPEKKAIMLTRTTAYLLESVMILDTMKFLYGT